MEKPIYINFGKDIFPIALQFLPVSKPIELDFGRESETILISVTNFPIIKPITINPLQVAANASIRLHTFEWRLVKETDPFVIAVDMDNKTLREIDIKENTNIYNID